MNSGCNLFGNSDNVNSGCDLPGNSVTRREQWGYM